MADPQRLQAATRKLASAGAADFAALVDKADAKASTARPAPGLGYAGSTGRVSAKQSPTNVAASSTEAAYQALGGLLLQKMFESAMPDRASSLFGKGAPGATWKSMLAQQLAGGVSASIFKLPRTGAAHASEDASIAKAVAAPPATFA